MSAVQNTSLPFQKEEAMNELKEILFVQASQISLALNPEAANQFLGVEIDSWDSGLHDDDREKIDLKRFNITGLVERAYDFAFQTNAYWQFDGDDWYEICGFSAGVTPHSFEGSQSPWLWDNGRVRHVVDMSIARYELQENHTISIRGLSLLAGMTEAAVRNSLSKEGIQTTGKPASVENETALKWLSERRGFIPTRANETQEKNREQHISFQLDYHPFPEALSLITRDVVNGDLEPIASATGISADQLRAIMAGEMTLIDIEKLSALSRALNVSDLPKFVAKAVEFALRSGAA
jgi:transcriptional regulator with XRE-family HTH domain